MASDAGPVVSEEGERKAQAVLDQIKALGAVVFFEKPLTASDLSGSGRVVIPKAIAEQYFPRLEQPSGLPVRAVDIRGHEYQFKFRFWINNQSRMYLLEGAGQLHHQFHMSVGDVMVFAQKPDRTLVVAGRPATKHDIMRKPPAKRQAGAAEPGAPRQRSNKSEGKGSGRTPRTAGGQAGGGERARKRTKGMLELLEPAVDGIFRAVPLPTPQQLASTGVSTTKSGRWVVTLNLAGELYQAHFDVRDDADEAYNAAGGVLTKADADLAAAAAAAEAPASDAAEAAAGAGAGGGGGEEDGGEGQGGDE